MARIEEELKSRFQSEQQKAMINIMFTANWLRSLHSTRLKPHGLSTEQYNILRILNGAGERMNMLNVRSRMIDPSPNTTRLMDRLLEKGAIERERSADDRRVVFVKLTDKGKLWLDEINDDLDDFFRSIELSLNVKESKTLNELVESFRAGVMKNLEKNKRNEDH